MRWCRLYSEFATDPKVQIMPEAMQRRLVMLFCLHAEGSLEAMTDEILGFTLHVNAEELQRTKELFVKQGFLERETWIPRNWAKRQRASDDTNARVKRYRERDSSDSNATVTLQKLKCSGGGSFPPLPQEIEDGLGANRGGAGGERRGREGERDCNVTNPLQSPTIHSTDSPAAQKVRDDAVRRWGVIDFDADMQANELIRTWGDRLAAHGLDKAFRVLGSKEKPWAYANTICRGGMPLNPSRGTASGGTNGASNTVLPSQRAEAEQGPPPTVAEMREQLAALKAVPKPMKWQKDLMKMIENDLAKAEAL